MLSIPHVLLEELLPERNIVKGGFVRHVEHQQSAVGVLEVVGDQRPKTLLTSCVPQLQAIALALLDHVFSQEVDPDGWLGGWRNTLAVYSKRWLMNWSMMQVLPTLASPNRTILILVLPDMVVIEGEKAK